MPVRFVWADVQTPNEEARTNADEGNGCMNDGDLSLEDDGEPWFEEESTMLQKARLDPRMRKLRFRSCLSRALRELVGDLVEVNGAQRPLCGLGHQNRRSVLHFLASRSHGRKGPTNMALH